MEYFIGDTKFEYWNFEIDLIMKKLTLGFSPCPNDTFIFDALIHGKIDTEELDFEVRMADIEAVSYTHLTLPTKA